jgi:hypothetical protein
MSRLTHPAAAAFVMIGAEPHTRLGTRVTDGHGQARRERRGLVKLNDRGFIRTGRDVPWRMAATPSTPAVRDELAGAYFAAGDVRYGSVKHAPPGPSARGCPGQDLRGTAAGLSPG